MIILLLDTSGGRTQKEGGGVFAGEKDYWLRRGADRKRVGNRMLRIGRMGNI